MGTVYVYYCPVIGRRMKPFECLTSEQVTSVHRLYHFLRKLKVIGVVFTTTEQMRNTGVGHPIRYKLTFTGYDHSMRNKMTPEEALQELFNESERLGLYNEDLK